jgi:hypothetical protein
MKESNMPPLELPAYPRIWPFMLGLLILIPLWMVALNLWIKPAFLQLGRAEMGRTLALYLIPPILSMGAMLVGWFGLVSHRRTQAQQNYDLSVLEVERQKTEEAARAAKEREDHRFTLEVLGLGLSVEKFRQQGVWQAIENSGGAFILSADPKTYAWSRTEKIDQSDKRQSDAFEHAASYFTEKWVIPGFAATASLHKPLEDDHYLKIFPDALRQGAGMAWHKFENVGWLYDDAPEGFMEQVFRFFDENPDVPAVAVYVEDGNCSREVLRPEGSPHWLVDGYRKPTDMTESMVAFVLARRDRLEALRASALDVSLRNLPHPSRPMPEEMLASGHKPFWEKPQPFRPTKWLPRPWCKEQLEQIDKLPLLGRLHRPQAAPFVHDGKPLGDKARLEAFQKTWKLALETLPQGKEPARVIYDCGPLKQQARITPLVRVLHDSGSAIDVHGKTGVNLTQALGDTGATSFFVGMALGTFASHQHQDVTVVVSFRRSDCATIVMIEPPTPEERQKDHPSGEDPLNVPVVPYEK